MIPFPKARIMKLLPLLLVLFASFSVAQGQKFPIRKEAWDQLRRRQSQDGDEQINLSVKSALRQGESTWEKYQQTLKIAQRNAQKVGSTSVGSGTTSDPQPPGSSQAEISSSTDGGHSSNPPHSAAIPILPYQPNGNPLSWMARFEVGEIGSTRSVNLMLDTGSTDLVISKRSLPVTGKHSIKAHPTHVGFEVHYVSTVLNGIVYRSDLSIGGFYADKVYFGLSDTEIFSTEDSHSLPPPDGILGLGFLGIASFTLGETFFDKLYLANSLTSRQFSFDISLSSRERDSEFYLGGSNQERYDASTLKWVPVSTLGYYWSVNFNWVLPAGESQGSQGTGERSSGRRGGGRGGGGGGGKGHAKRKRGIPSEIRHMKRERAISDAPNEARLIKREKPSSSKKPSHLEAIIDTGTNLAIGSLELFQQVLAFDPSFEAFQISEEGERMTVLLKVPCNKDSFNPIVLDFGEKKFEWRPRIFYDPEGNHGKKLCFLGVLGKDVSGDVWILGDTFLESQYVIFDVDRNAVGFADKR
ncbi:acid protease [Violaceomyces palustris]|uniref:Acid protease n=1 Tax=Violaceomyces palustris TaxID=1673888 RepID=A0ACD0NNA4_9BASI|nr:acid protease [Violaceomyces palustris]